jgi:hypothetical protein
MPSIQDLLTQGIALVPIPYGLKRPTTPGWNARHNVLTSPNQAHLAANMNIGIAHAYCSPTPTCAIDLDDYKEAIKWFTSNNIDLVTLIAADDSVVIHSGKENSLKLLFKLPTGVIPIPSKQIKTASNAMMVEFRCAASNGLTVQDVLPPSIHPSGSQYDYVGKGSILNLPIIPNDIFQIWLGLGAPTFQKAQKVISTQEESPRNKAVVQAKLACVSADCDYFTYRDVVWSILSTGWTCAEQLAENWCRKAPHRFDDANFTNVVNSYDPNKTNPITLGTLNFLAKKGGWNG